MKNNLGGKTRANVMEVYEDIIEDEPEAPNGEVEVEESEIWEDAIEDVCQSEVIGESDTVKAEESKVWEDAIEDVMITEAEESEDHPTRHQPLCQVAISDDLEDGEGHESMKEEDDILDKVKSDNGHKKEFGDKPEENMKIQDFKEYLKVRDFVEDLTEEEIEELYYAFKLSEDETEKEKMSQYTQCIFRRYELWNMEFGRKQRFSNSD